MSDLKQKDRTVIEERLGRPLNEVEAGIFSVMWSEHCSYRTSKPTLRRLFSTSKRKLIGEGENAGILDIGNGYFTAFKMESHNHPSAIEPYQGAATGVGGILRDIFTMGARPVASADPLRFGPMSEQRSRHLLEEVVKGISDYGNSVGVPTISGETQFDRSYSVNCLVNVFALGIGKKSSLVRGVARGEGNLVLYFGSRTGRDGVHGATFASDELNEESKKQRPSVQIANPFEEKKLIEACMELAEKGLLVAMQDMGAAGLTSSSVEMAARGGVGMEMDLSLVPLRQDDVTFYEMMLSETQERMLSVVNPKNLGKVTAILEKNEIEWAVIGKVIKERSLVLKSGSEPVADIPLYILLENIPPANAASEEYSKESGEAAPVRSNAVPDTFVKILSSDLVNSKHWIYEQYDSRVGCDTLKCPGDGPAVLRVEKTRKALSISCLGLEEYVEISPFKGGYATVARAFLEHLLLGFEPIGITDCLNFGNPEDPKIMFQFNASVEGMNEAAKTLNVPVISGNVSFYNENETGAVKPLLEIGMVGLSENHSKKRPAAFRNLNGLIYTIELSSKTLSPSVYSKEMETAPYAFVPEFDKNKLELFIRTFKKHGHLMDSVRVQPRGGTFTGIFKMALQREFGFEIMDASLEDLFAEGPGIVIAEVEKACEKAFLHAFSAFTLCHIGNIKEKEISVNGMTLDRRVLTEAYFNTFGEHFQ